MNVYLIKASAPGPFKEYKKAMGAPPQNIFSVAACTPEGVGISMCDETIGMKPKINSKADIVAIFFHTPDALHAYKLADKCRTKGRTVVLGGLHPTFMPDEAAEHADSILMGEAEGIWEELINDYQNRTLKKTYQRDRPVDMADLKPFPTDIIPPSQYDHIWTVMVSRGCVHKCEFCTVPPFFCGKYRLRPIENIVAEIEAVPTDWFELHADNLTANRDYALKLFEALKPLNIKWSGEATIKLADDAELLQTAADSGCHWLLIGIETPSQAALKDSGKGFVTPDTIREKISRFHEHGIQVTSSMIFGFDTHTPEIFRESEQFCRYIGIDEVEAVLLIPFPGTPLYERLDSEKRLLTKDWSKYDGSHAVFNPKHMTPEELEAGASWFWNEIRKKKALDLPAGDKSTRAPGMIKNGGPALTTFRSPVRWKSVVALIVIGLGFFFNWYWIWGVLLIIWAIIDLRTRHAYLLDDIPRSESPLLYWIVVLMWLVMGVWALSTSPMVSNFSDHIKSEYHLYDDQRLHAGGDVQPARPKDPAKEVPRYAVKTIGNDRFGFEIKIPDHWEKSRQMDQTSVTLDLQNRDGNTTVTVVAFDHGLAFTQASLIAYLENQLQADLPFLKNEKPSTVTLEPTTIDTSGTQMVFKQYRGKLEGYRTTAQIGYAIKKSYGYAVIGVFWDKDKRGQNAVNKILQSFRLERS